MPVILEDRPIEQVREESIDKLIVNYSHGIISAEAFERRLDDATFTESHQRLVDLVADLPMEVNNDYARYKDTQFSPRYQAAEGNDEERIICVLGSDERSGCWVVPRKLVIYNLLGTLKLDFSDAVFTHQEVIIEVKDLLGSLELLVTGEINVTTKIAGFLSSTENTAPSMGGRQAPSIKVQGLSILSSVEVTEKKTMKEKWVAFADSIKKALGGK